LRLVVGVLGLEVLAADPAGDRPESVLLGPDPERPGWLAAAGDLEPLAGLAGGLLAIAVLPIPALVMALAAEQAQAAEGVAVQPNGCAQIGEGVGIGSQGLLGQLHELPGRGDGRPGSLSTTSTPAGAG
jgi:hypothetical protein